MWQGGKLTCILTERPFRAQTQIVDGLGIMANGSDRSSKWLREHQSPLRSMMAEASGNTYTALETLVAAREHPGSVVIFEGDDGGTIYLTIPVREVACDEPVLRQL